MSIEKIEKNKAKVDLFIFVFFILWIALRVMDNVNYEGMQLAIHFFRLFLVFSGLFLMMYYLYFNKQLTDEFERENKLKAHKFSWIFTMLSAIVLFILSNKSVLNAQFALELLLWIGYFSYFLSFKFLDSGLDAKFSEKYTKIIGFIAVFCTSLVVGMNIGYKMPKLAAGEFNDHKAIYIVISIFLTALAIIMLLKFVKMVKQEEAKKGKKGD